MKITNIVSSPGGRTWNLDHIRNFLKGAILFTVQIQIVQFDSRRLIRFLACLSVSPQETTRLP